MPVNFKSAFNKGKNGYEQMPTNKMKYLPGTKSLYQPVTVFRDFECMVKNSNKESNFFLFLDFCCISKICKLKVSLHVTVI